VGRAGLARACAPSKAPGLSSQPRSLQRAPPCSIPPADAVVPTLTLTGNTPVNAEAAPGARTTKITSGWPTLTASDAVAPPVVTCRASLDGAPEGPVTDGAGGTDFPYGITLVKCTAADAAGNVSPAVAFTVAVTCGAGYSVRSAGGNCESERGGGVFDRLRRLAANAALCLGKQVLTAPATPSQPLSPAARQQRVCPGRRQHLLSQRRLLRHRWLLLLRLQDWLRRLHRRPHLQRCAFDPARAGPRAHPPAPPSSPVPPLPQSDSSF
jgi:hypothetical protein